MIHDLKIIFRKNDESGYGSYMGSLMHGVLMEHISSEYADKMHISQMHPYSQHTCFENGRLVWYITVLNDEAGRYITDVLNPVEKHFNKSSNVSKHMKIISENEELLRIFLNSTPETAGKLDAFNKIMEVQLSVSDICEYERFIEGFQLGAKLMLELFLKQDSSELRDIQ